MHRYALIPSLMVFTACCLSLGCNNPPGALKLRLVPERLEIRSGEPVRVAAVFSADRGRICIDRPTPNRFKVELTYLDSGESQVPVQIGYCGLNGLLLLPLAPAMYVGAGLDVADLGDRYAVVSPGNEFGETFDLVGLENERFIVFKTDETDRHGYERDASWPPPGRYRLTMKFQSDTSNVYPRPLFWTVYDQPVEAAMALTVKKR